MAIDPKDLLGTHFLGLAVREPGTYSPKGD